MIKLNHFFVSLLVLVLTLTTIFSYVYLSPLTSDATEPAAYMLSAAHLYEEYESGYEESNGKYFNKIIEVKGIVKEHDKNRRELALFCGKGNAEIICKLEYPGNNIPRGRSITVKGVCEGKNNDGNIYLRRCLILR